MLGTEGQRVAQRDAALGKVFWSDGYYTPKDGESTASTAAVQVP